MDYTEVMKTEAAREFRLPKPVTEDNWKGRMNFCSNLAEAIITYGHGDRYPTDFPVMIEPYLNNILDCAVSERTQLSNAACKLLGTLPKVLVREMHHHIDRILPVLIKLCANTKQVTVKIAAAATSNVIQYSTYSPRLLWHVCQVFEEKSAGPKQNGTLWLQIIIKEYHKSITSHKDYEMICRALSLALEDADAQVRTSSRATYWLYSKIDASGAEEIMEKLNRQQKTALQNDPHNPDKKAGGKIEPPRPKSALAQVRKEQQKKKLAAEAGQAQNKTFSTSTASHDSIEIHEPRTKKDKPKREGPMQADNGKWLPAVKPETKPPTHKKTLSQDNEVVAKPSASSRLLSAPVRRPRINVTPMSAPQTSRPSSRTGHAAQPREPQREPQREARPTSSSSSSWKTATTSTAIPSPRVRPASPRARPVHIPDGQENVSVVASSKGSPPITIATVPARRSPRKPAPPTEKQVNSAIYTPIEKAMDPSEVGAIAGYGLEGISLNPLYPDHTSPKKILDARPVPKQNDQASARRFLATAMKQMETFDLDPLGYRKLKNIIAQHGDQLITNKETWDTLFENLVDDLSGGRVLRDGKDDVNEIETNFVYNKQVILQITILLMDNYSAYALPRQAGWLMSMILYRLTLPNDLAIVDRRVQYVQENLLYVINNSPQPLDLIVSALEALDTGERIFTEEMGPIGPTEVDRPQGTIKEGSVFVMEDPNADENPQPYKTSTNTRVPSDTYQPPRSCEAFGSPHQYSFRSKWKLIGDETARVKGGDYEAGYYHIEAYTRRAMKEYQGLEDKHKQPVNRKLALLYEFTLFAIAQILRRATLLDNLLEEPMQERLGELATYALTKYDHIVKRATVPFIRALYGIMDDEDKFWSFFTTDSEMNLVQYYLASEGRATM